MSWMSYAMDGVLIALLLAALMFGARLHKQLKALRAGQEDFARAVADLDRAAISAHSSLKELRKDADESQDLLHGRILAGRDVLQKLEAQLSRAERQLHEIDQAIAARAAVLARPQTSPPPEPRADTHPLVFRASSAARPSAPTEDDYNPAWSAPKKTGAVRAQGRDQARDRDTSARDRSPFDRDVVVPQNVAAPQNPAAQRSQLPPRQHFEARQASEEAEMLEKVQISELVVANLNEMIRSLGMPKRQAPVTLEQDLFGEDDD